jgi:hypothetical protein
MRDAGQLLWPHRCRRATSEITASVYRLSATTCILKPCGQAPLAFAMIAPLALFALSMVRQNGHEQTYRAAYVAQRVGEGISDSRAMQDYDQQLSARIEAQNARRDDWRHRSARHVYQFANQTG